MTNALDFVLQRIDDERQGRAEWVYGLWEIYRLIPDVKGLPGSVTPRRSLVNDVSSAKNIASHRIEHFLQVPERIPWNLLTEHFPSTPEGKPTWCANLTWTHLEKVALAGGDKFPARVRVQWLVKASDSHMNTSQLIDYLRSIGVIKAQKRGSKWTSEDGAKEASFLVDLSTAAEILKQGLAGEKGDRARKKALDFITRNEPLLNARPPVPTSACELMERIADDLRRRGIDVDLRNQMTAWGNRPMAAIKTLRKVLDMLDQAAPGVTVQFSDEMGIQKREEETA